MARWGGLEARLFAWLLLMALAPALAVLVVATWVGAGSLDWFGTLGPWNRLAESGRALFEAVEPVAAEDPAVAEALGGHRNELSESLIHARRWAVVGERAAAALPAVALGLALGLIALALVGSRRLARQLARPIAELVDWARLLGREEPLPEPTPSERTEVREVRVLRGALRGASQELERARNRALAAERVRIWGEMARRLAHEMKNPLTPLRLAAYRLEMAESASTVQEAAEVVREETDRLEALAQRFAAMGRPPEGPTSPVDLVELLTSLVEKDIPPSVEVHFESDAPPVVDAHYEALVRAFRNLLRNAVEALEEVEPSARRIEVRVRRRAARHVSGRPEAEIVIADSGPGLPPGDEERIFDPDFTTRDRGAGLGLALVRQTIQSHGGEIEARNRPGGGAEFQVRIPATMNAPAPAPSAAVN